MAELPYKPDYGKDREHGGQQRLAGRVNFNHALPSAEMP